MSSRHDRLRLLRQQIGPRIDRLPRLARTARLADFVAEIDDLRKIADSYDMPCLSDMAHSIENLAANGWSVTLADHYFAAMDAALLADSMDVAAQRAVMASVAIYRVH